MGKAAIKQNDRILATDMHLVVTGASTQLLPHSFDGAIDANLSANVRIGGQPAATAGSTATNTPPHVPAPPGTAFQVPPTNQGVIVGGSATVRINGKPAARVGDTAQTCADPTPNTAAQLLPQGAPTVFIGG